MVQNIHVKDIEGRRVSLGDVQVLASQVHCHVVRTLEMLVGMDHFPPGTYITFLENGRLNV